MKVLFVCTGNTCRSCMAEAIFNNLCNISEIKAFSAGISIVHDSKITPHSASLINQNFDLNISDRKAIQLSNDMIFNSDLILTMTESICNLLRTKYPEMKDKIFSLNEYVGIKGDIIDPYGGDIAIYSKTFKNLKNSIIILLQKLKEDKCTSL